MSGHALVADDDRAAFGEQAPARAEHVDRVRHVVQRLVDVDEVVLPVQPRIGGVAVMERDAALDAAPVEVLSRRRDRGLVGVDSVDLSLRIRACDRDRRVALAAGDVRDTRRRIGLEALVHLGNLRKPLAAEQLVEDRTRELGLPLVKVGAVVRIGNAVAALVRGEQVRRSGARTRRGASRTARRS